MRDRRFREDDRELGRRREGQFDPLVEGARYGLTPDVSRAVWEAVCRATRCAEPPAENDTHEVRFRELATLVAQRGGYVHGPPGKWTQLDIEAWRRHPTRDRLTSPDPGRTTRVEADERARGVSDVQTHPVSRAEAEMPSSSLALLATSPLSTIPAMVHRHAAGAGYIVKRADLLGLLAGSAGTPLAAELSQELAEKLGDIDGVRVHTGSAADAASRYLQADAFVLGRNIFFARGKFDPGSQAGQRLIAHEVAHTAQPVVEAGCEITVSSPGDEHEQAADAFADAVMAGGPRAADVRGEPARLQPFAGISRSVAAPFTSETASS